MLLREFNLRDAEIGADGRTLVLACVPYGSPALVDDGDGPYSEEFKHGAFAGVIKAANRTELRYAHRMDSLPYGYALDLIEDPSHLIGRFRVAPSDQGDQLISLVRDDQLGGVSIGFIEGINEESTRSGMRHVIRTRIKRLPEVSLTPVPAYNGAEVLAIREAPEIDLGAIERERLRWQRARMGLL